MHIHYFNPDHEIAMAMNRPRYEMPRVTREMRRDLGFISAVWADDGDCVVVDELSSFKNYKSQRYISLSIRGI